MNLGWQEKAAALNALAPISLLMRDVGDWYVQQATEIKVMLRSDVPEGKHGNGGTPVEAIEDHWRRLTDLPRGKYVVVHAGDPARRQAVRWNGFMWARVDEGNR